MIMCNKEENQQIRVLHVLDSLRIGSGIAGYTMNLYRNIDRDKVQFDFLVIFHVEDSYCDEIQQLGGRIHYLHSPSRSSIRQLVVSYIQYVKSISDFFSNGHKYSAIHSHTATLSGYIFKEAKKQGISCRILHSHSIAYSDSKNFIKDIRNYLFIMSAKKRANQYFACSPKAGEFLFGKRAASRGLVQVVANGIEISKFKFSPEIRANYRQSMGLEDNLVVGHVGKMIPIKNQIMLLRIFASLYEKRHDVVLLFVGVGELYHQLLEEARKLGIDDRIRFLGMRQDIDKLMQAMDCVVMPSITEGLSLVTIEAQAAGLPVFVSDGIPDEACVVNATKINLTESAPIWADTIIRETTSFIRSDESSKISEAGYNILATAMWLQEFYRHAPKASPPPQNVV